MLVNSMQENLDVILPLKVPFPVVGLDLCLVRGLLGPHTSSPKLDLSRSRCIFALLMVVSKTQTDADCATCYRPHLCTACR